MMSGRSSSATRNSSVSRKLTDIDFHETYCNSKATPKPPAERKKKPSFLKKKLNLKLDTTASDTNWEKRRKSKKDHDTPVHITTLSISSASSRESLRHSPTSPDAPCLRRKSTTSRNQKAQRRSTADADRSPIRRSSSTAVVQKLKDKWFDSNNIKRERSLVRQQKSCPLPQASTSSADVGRGRHLSVPGCPADYNDLPQAQSKFVTDLECIEAQMRAIGLIPNSSLTVQVTKKYENLQELEEMRSIANLTSLMRRRNSLKLKCKQFESRLDKDKENQRQPVSAWHANVLKKIAVIEEKISKHQENAMATSAKVDLQCCLELYNLAASASETMQERKRTSDERSLSSGELPTNCPCNSDNCDCKQSSHNRSASVDFPLNGGSNFNLNEKPAYHRPLQHTNSGSKSDSLSLESVSNSPRWRSPSIEHSVTSDCDSGFETGDALWKRSDKSLDKFDKCSSSSTNVFVYSSTDEVDSTVSSEAPYLRKEVSSHVLAQIEDFEVFAKKTLHRINHNGILIPLKSPS